MYFGFVATMTIASAVIIVGALVADKISGTMRRMEKLTEKKAAIKEARWSQIFAMTDLKGGTK